MTSERVERTRLAVAAVLDAFESAETDDERETIARLVSALYPGRGTLTDRAKHGLAGAIE